MKVKETAVASCFQNKTEGQCRRGKEVPSVKGAFAHAGAHISSASYSEGLEVGASFVPRNPRLG